MIIGTAGHIDHGKTTLVRALTGVDTDRLPEEKARGITIELGYAYMPLASGDVLGFVDVPGHEKFVPTMLAGATGIDFAMLVVAADDGAMPQTREHLDILTLLGIERGAIVITKVDAVDADRLAAVERELRALVVPTLLAGAPIFAVSGRTGTGVDTLRSFLAQQAQAAASRSDYDREFRLAVDRSFTLPGIGTVVTGTVHSGVVRAGDNVTIAPSGQAVRVRTLHTQGRASDRGTSGQRCALNLAAIARDDVVRGDWIVAPAVALSTQRVDGRLALLAREQKPLRSGAMVHLHVGAMHVPARVVVLDSPSAGSSSSTGLAPGTSRLVQLIAQRPIATWHGDRFIVRDESASRTLGGGRLLDPYAPPRYRRSAERLTILAALEASSVEERLHALMAQAASGVDLARFARGGNVREPARLLPPRARRVLRDGADFAVGEAQWGFLKSTILDTLRTFHHDHMDELGPDGTRLKRIALPRLDNALFRALVADLAAVGDVRQSGPWLHLPDHESTPSPQERALFEKLLPRLLDGRFEPPWVRDLARDAGQPEALVRSALIRASKRGQTFQVVRDLFYHPAAIRDLAALANALQDADGDVRAAAFRDATGLGRKRAIQVLEFFDRVGFTRRVRDRHIVRADNLLAVGGTSVAPLDGRSRDATEKRNHA